MVEQTLETAVFCLGSPLRGDDGVASYVADLLNRGKKSDRSWTVILLPDPSLLFEYFTTVKRMIVVDALSDPQASEQGGEQRSKQRSKDGQVQHFRLNGEGPPEAMKTSTHALSLTEWLRLGTLLGNTPPEVVVFGITGSEFRPGAALSEEVRRGAEECATQIEGYLARGQARDA